MSSELSALFSNLSEQCRREWRQLDCQHQDAEQPSSRLVCTARDDHNPSVFSIYVLLMSLIVTSVTLALLLNAAVMVTVMLNRRLHTIINYLVILGCLNNILWTALPLLEANVRGQLSDFACKVRFFVVRLTPANNFFLLVTTTFLRYLIVMKNRRFHASRRNIFTVSSFALLPSFLSIALIGEYGTSYGRCSETIAWTPDNFKISIAPQREDREQVLILAASMYGIGFVILALCYASILKKAVNSRRLVQSHAMVNMARQLLPRSLSARFGVRDNSTTMAAPARVLDIDDGVDEMRAGVIGTSTDDVRRRCDGARAGDGGSGGGGGDLPATVDDGARADGGEDGAADGGSGGGGGDLAATADDGARADGGEDGAADGGSGGGGGDLAATADDGARADGGEDGAADGGSGGGGGDLAATADDGTRADDGEDGAADGGDDEAGSGRGRGDGDAGRWLGDSRPSAALPEAANDMSQTDDGEPDGIGDDGDERHTDDDGHAVEPGTEVTGPQADGERRRVSGSCSSGPSAAIMAGAADGTTPCFEAPDDVSPSSAALGLESGRVLSVGHGFSGADHLVAVAGVETDLLHVPSASTPAPPPRGKYGSSRRGLRRRATEPAPIEAPAPAPVAGRPLPAVLASRTGPLAREDIVATASLIAFLVIFMISFAPYISVIFVDKNFKCIIMPHARFQLWVMLITSGGITAVLNPLVFVLFSADFRKAFVSTWTKFRRWLSSRSSPEYFD